VDSLLAQGKLVEGGVRRYRIFAVKTCLAEYVCIGACGLYHSLKTEIIERGHIKMFPDFLYRFLSSDEFCIGREINTIVTRLAGGGTADEILLFPVVPLMIESSITTTRLPSRKDRTGLSFTLTLKSRMDWVGWIKVRPT
jgi:hypothetical protein